MRDFSSDIAELLVRVESAKAYLGFEGLMKERDDLEKEISDPGLWSNPDRAKAVSKRFTQVSDDLGIVLKVQAELDNIQAGVELAQEEESEELEEEIAGWIRRLGSDLSALETRSLLYGEFDEGDAVCEVHAGAGGTDAQDWAEMMFRMYTRFASERGFEVEIDEVTEGQEAGILSATFIVKGRYAYGVFSAEKGVHRLVRISPFDSQKRRQTSFARLEVIPFIEDLTAEVDIDEKDLRVDTYRSSGAGGQHVNKTDSAVRITHIPSGIVVSCQNERSQHQNRAKAMQILAAKLADLQRQQRKDQISAISGPAVDNAWGNQIRSYVLAPYQMVKDHRSNFEDRNVIGVLAGDLEGFISSFLMWRRSQVE